MLEEDNPTPKRATSRLRVIRFESELENVLKRHQPIEWALAVAAKLRSIVEGQTALVWPPYELLHTIEACCAYARGHRSEPVTELRLRQAVNVFREHESPYEEHLLLEDDDVHMAFLVMHRRQIEVQRNALEVKHLCGRYHLLFNEGDSFGVSKEILDDRHGLSLDTWAAYCKGAFGRAVQNRSYCVQLQPYVQHAPEWFSDRSLSSFVSLSSRTTGQIASEYRESRAALISPHLHVCLRSGFLSKPLIDFGEDRLLAPAPHLLMPHLIAGLENAISEVDPSVWANECGACMERYVYRLLSTTFPGRDVRRPDREGDDSDRPKRCDFSIELDDCHLFIECKATRLRQQLLVRDRLVRDASSQRMQEAVAQLSATASEASNDKPLLGIIVILDEIFQANRDWYWKHAIVPKLPAVLRSGHDYAGPLMRRPQIMPLVAFELLISLLRHGYLLLDLVIEQTNGNGDLSRGDWARTLAEKCRTDKVNPTVPEITAAFDSFLERLRPAG